MPQWTDEQLSAIKARNSNLLVAAAAGSGKTAVLVQRIIDLLVEDKVDIDRLLVVTFTNAAAGEMRERVGKAIIEELEKKNEHEEYFRRQLNLLVKAPITTLHSFCKDVVRKYFHLLEIDPNFRITDQTELAIMVSETIDEVFECEYEKANEEFLGLVERYGGSREDKQLQELVIKLYNFIQSKPFPQKWLAQCVAAFNLDKQQLSQSVWVESLMQQISLELDGANDILREAKQLCYQPGGPEAYLPLIDADLEQVEDLLKLTSTSFDSLYQQLEKIVFGRLPRMSKDCDESLKDEAKSLRDQAKDIVKSIKETIGQKSPEQYLKELNELFPYMTYLYKLVENFGQIYYEKKSEKGLVDFNDLEHFALEILSNDQVAEEYKHHFAYIFVDEYQDSNVVQETILNFIKKENNLFMVGDVKQSIYRFRLADPSLFIDKYESYQCDSDQLNRRIDLSKNFRSRSQILTGVNFIFKNIMSKEIGEITYNQQAYLYEGRTHEPINDVAIELKLVEKTSEVEGLSEELESLEDVEVEARVVVSRIKSLLNSKIYDDIIKDYRKVEYKDIAVLLRSTSQWAPVFLEILLEAGIPAYADTNSGYFEVSEIQVFMNLLRVIDNRRQDLPLLSVLRSSIGGLDLEDLIKIRINYKHGTFFEAILNYVENWEDRLSNQLVDFLNRLDGWVTESRYLKIDEFIWKVLTDTGYYYYVGALPDGVQRQANLRILLARAEQFQKTAYRGLFNFINFIDKLNNSSGDMGAAKTLTENDNVVRVMSIHKSKGLEFPYVIVAGLGKNFNLTDANADVLFHKDLGLGPKYVNPDIRKHSETIARSAIKSKIKLEALSEEMRILYVALTRPKDKLILIGSGRDLAKKAKNWSKSLSIYQLSRAKNYLDWICPVILRHKDGQVLRELGGVHWDSSMLFEDTSEWNISIVEKSDIQLDLLASDRLIKEVQATLENCNGFADTGFKQVVETRLEWQYPYFESTKIPSKISVTDIKRASVKSIESMGLKIPSLIKKPKFLEEKKSFTAVEKGTIVHHVLQNLNLSRVKNRDEIEEQLEQMVVRHLLLENEAKAVDVNKINKFFDSKIGQRMLQSKEVYREVPFNLLKNASQVISGMEQSQEQLLVQGVIDCYFIEQDGIVLLDYKTDYLPNRTAKEAVIKYESQLKLYREALEAITGNLVKETYLYLFDLDEEVKL